MNKKVTLADKIAEWRGGSAGFFKWLEDVKPLVLGGASRYVPYAFPSDEVKAEVARALDGPYSTIIWLWPRRHGKTLLTAMILTWQFTTQPNQTIALLANSKNQAVDVCFKLIRSTIQHTPYLKSLLDSGSIKVQAESIVYEALANVITGYANNPDALWGLKLSAGQCSELHAARDPRGFEILAGSVLDTEGGRIFIDSTVGSKSSPLYALVQAAERGEPGIFVSHIKYSSLEDAIARQPSWISGDKLRSLSATMLPALFSMMHLNVWGASASSLFTEEIIKKSQSAYPIDVKALAEGRAFAVGAGLDRAYGFSLHGDQTVTTAVMKVMSGDEEEYFVLDSSSIAFSSAAGIKRNLSAYAKDFGMTRAALESYNSQDVAAWAGEQKWQHETIHPTAERQANAFTTLFNIANDGRLHIHPKFSKLLKEMEVFEYTLEATGTSRGTIPRFEAAKGQHDDFLYSLAWAIYSLRDIELNPYELAGIHCSGMGPAVQLCQLNRQDVGVIPPCAESCRSMIQAQALYRQYVQRAGCVPMTFSHFFLSKVVNVGSHTVPR
jgi:hypothetical protein